MLQQTRRADRAGLRLNPDPRGTGKRASPCPLALALVRQAKATLAREPPTVRSVHLACAMLAVGARPEGANAAKVRRVELEPDRLPARAPRLAITPAVINGDGRTLALQRRRGLKLSPLGAPLQARPLALAGRLRDRNPPAMLGEPTN